MHLNSIRSDTSVSITEIPSKAPIEKAEGDPVSEIGKRSLEESQSPIITRPHSYSDAPPSRHLVRRLSQTYEDAAAATRSRSHSADTSSIRLVGKFIPVQLPDGRVVTRKVPSSAMARLATKGKFSETQIRNAVEVFVGKCDSSWAKLKAMSGTPGFEETLTIINQLRAAQLEHLSEQLKAKYTGLVIHDFGSKDPTSDLDLSFEMPVERRHEEIQAVAEFNKMFEAEFGQSSALVFDCNAYTAYHVEEIFTPAVKEEQLQLQVDMSRVMLFKHAAPDAVRVDGKLKNADVWENIKKEAAKNEGTASKFEWVENFREQLDLMFDKKIIEICIPEKDRAKILNDPARIRKEATKFKNDPKFEDFIVRAENELHKEIRLESQTLQKQHYEITKYIKEPSSEQYETAVKGIIHFHEKEIHAFEQQIKELNSQIEKMKDSPEKEKLQQTKEILEQEKNFEIRSRDEAAAKLTLTSEEQLHPENSVWLKEKADKILLAKQRVNTKGMYFAREAHISEGAFVFTVRKVQKGESDAASDIGSCLQATNELLGFFHAHKRHVETPALKLIESSKYIGPRMRVAFSEMNKVATKISKPFPIEKSEIERMQGLFDGFYALRRSTSMLEKDKISKAEELTKQYDMPLDVDAIDKMLNGYVGAVNAWAEDLSFEELQAA